MGDVEMHRVRLLLCAVLASFAAPQLSAQAEICTVKLRQVKDLVIYQQERYYAAFPSIVTRPTGELILAFRRSPERAFVRDGRGSHADPNSYLVLVRSKDNASSWTTDPELIHAHAWGGSQDPCMVQLHDGSIVCSSYAWYIQRNKNFVAPPQTMRTAQFNDHTAIARSTDGGKSFAPWEDAGFQGHPHYALRLPNDQVLLIYGYRHKPPVLLVAA
jgi:hypothetical protein